MSKKILISMSASLAIMACSKKADESTQASSTDNVKGAFGVVNNIDNALASAGSAVPGTLGISVSNLNLASTVGKNKICTVHGEPLKAGVTADAGSAVQDSDRMDMSDKTYSSTLFYCLASMETDSPETIRGSLTQFKSVLCSFEKAIGKDIEYTEAGNDLTGGTGSLKVTLESGCWPQGTPDGMTDITFTTATATKLADSTGFQNQLKFNNTEIDYNVSFFSSDGRIGFKKVGDGKDDGAGDYTFITLDTNTGTLLLDQVDDREGAGGADSGYRRAVRMKVKGTLASDGLSFKEIDSIQGIRASSANYASDKTSFSGQTLNGNKTDGFSTHNIQYSNSTITDSYKGCSGNMSDCTSTPLTWDTNNVVFYNMRTEWKAAKASGLPICDDNKDISFTKLPASGKLGKCE